MTNNLDFTCDWRFGFNVDPRRKGTVGYLLLWTGCGGITLSKDIEVWNPFSSAGQSVLSGATVKCVGLIESFSFAGGDDDPIRIRAYVSKGAASNLMAQQHAGISSTKLKLSWYIVSFDEERKAWYEAALIKDSGRADCVVDTQNGVLQLFVSQQPKVLAKNLDVRVYALEFQVAPAEGKVVNLEFATGPTTRFVRAWGNDDE